MTDDPARRPPAQTAGSLTTPDGAVYPPQFASRDLAAPPRTLIDLLIATATAHPEAPAIDDGTVVLRYREVLDVIATAHSSWRARAWVPATGWVDRRAHV